MSFASVGGSVAPIEIKVGGATVLAPARIEAAKLQAVKAGSLIVASGSVRVLVATKPVGFREGMEEPIALARSLASWGETS